MGATLTEAIWGDEPSESQQIAGLHLAEMFINLRVIATVNVDESSRRHLPVNQLLDHKMVEQARTSALVENMDAMLSAIPTI